MPKQHNTLLHVESPLIHKPLGCNAGVDGGATAVSNTVPSIEASVSLCYSTCQDETCVVSLLPTAVCYLLDDAGEMHFCRALLDTGSQKNYITEEFVSKLNSKTYPVNFKVCGVGGNTTDVVSKLSLLLSSCNLNYSMKTDFCVLKKVTDVLPAVKFSKSLLKWPSAVNLADPDFSLSKKIDIILGIQVFRLCFRDGQLDS